jgi:exosortase N
MNFVVAIKRGGIHMQWLGVLLCGYTVIMLIGLQDYIKPMSAQFILGTIAIATSLTRGTNDKQPLWLSMVALGFAIFYVVVPAKTILFISLAAAVMCVLATFHFTSNIVTIFSVGMMSPIFDYAVAVFSFPVKIYVTAAAAKVIALIQPDMRAEGNFLVSGASEFSVDTACLGLHMLTASMLAGLIVIAHFAKKLKSRVSVLNIVACLLLVFLLNVVSNLLRIVCLVFFKIAPDNFMHDVVGIACFMLYVIAPMLFLIPRCLNFFAWKMKTVEQENVARVLRINMVMNTLLLFILGMTVYATRDKSLNGELIPLKNISVPGYTATQLEHRVTKLYNENALVYIKPIAGFFSSDHQPMICWSGSGYEFTRIHEEEMGDTKVYAATLEKGDERLYTAWWYDNGISTTISQFEWRWDALKTRQHYAIVNVTAATPELLKIEVKKMILLKLGKRV